MQSLERIKENFEHYLCINQQPVKFSEGWFDVFMLLNSSNKACGSVLNSL